MPSDTTEQEDRRAVEERAADQLSIGLAVAMWSASGYVAAFMRASNVVWDVEEAKRGCQVKGGHPAEREPYLPPRDEPKTT